MAAMAADIMDLRKEMAILREQNAKLRERLTERTDRHSERLNSIANKVTDLGKECEALRESDASMRSSQLAQTLAQAAIADTICEHGKVQERLDAKIEAGCLEVARLAGGSSGEIQSTLNEFRAQLQAQRETLQAQAQLLTNHGASIDAILDWRDTQRSISAGLETRLSACVRDQRQHCTDIENHAQRLNELGKAHDVADRNHDALTERVSALECTVHAREGR
jgi:chromosome segregation ATPase